MLINSYLLGLRRRLRGVRGQEPPGDVPQGRAGHLPPRRRGVGQRVLVVVRVFLQLHHEGPGVCGASTTDGGGREESGVGFLGVRSVQFFYM